jgi:hypothetical protein
VLKLSALGDTLSNPIARRLVFDVPQRIAEVRDAAASRLGAELYLRSLGCSASRRATREVVTQQLLIGRGNIGSKALTSLSCITHSLDPLYQLVLVSMDQN